jgi:hypothetical protein
MTTIETQKQNKRIDKCLEYTEYKDSFLAILKEIHIEIKSIGNAYEFEEYKDFSGTNDYMNQERIVYQVRVKRGNKSISFRFCDSYNNAINNKQPELYDILASIGSEYDLNDLSFEEFCDEFGYNNDSIKAQKTYNNWVEHNKKLKQIFTSEEIETFPH